MGFLCAGTLVKQDKIWDFKRLNFLWPKKVSFLSRTSLNIISIVCLFLVCVQESLATLPRGTLVRTLLATPPPKKHSYANPASYAGYPWMNSEPSIYIFHRSIDMVHTTLNKQIPRTFKGRIQFSRTKIYSINRHSLTLSCTPYWLKHVMESFTHFMSS